MLAFEVAVDLGWGLGASPKPLTLNTPIQSNKLRLGLGSKTGALPRPTPCLTYFYPSKRGTVWGFG